jgi:hypothetical protein
VTPAEPTDTRHTAVLRWLDQRGQAHEERHVYWCQQRATTKAYRRARSMRLAGEASCFRIIHLAEDMIQ